jgi:hypothetical protein
VLRRSAGSILGAGREREGELGENDVAIGAILLSLVQPWGRRIPRRLRASLAWLGAIMAPLGLMRLGQTIAEAIAGDPFPMLTPAIYISVYVCFTVLGLTFAITAWRTRNPQAANRLATRGAPS